METTAEALAHGEWLFRGETKFVAGAMETKQLPAPALPEIAFAGRSNVGKSSLVNALTNRRTLARVSGTPGATRQVNFFTLREKLMLVDLPGYGYAKTSRKEVKGWSKLIYAYLKGRPNLKCVCVLIDARRGPKELDEELMTELDEAAVSYQVVFTKVDKVSAAERTALAERLTQLRRTHPALHPNVYYSSSHKGDGLEALRAELAQWVAIEKS